MRKILQRTAGIDKRPFVSSEGGFTLLELMVVMTIIVILATMATGGYLRGVEKAHEAVLKQDLKDMRKAINDYTLDKEQAPNSLDDLVSAQYLRTIPKDPMTGQADWNTSGCDTLLSPDQIAGGICDVNSSSSKVSPFDGTAYSSW
jgi:general secretion pathway protein G